jgi:glycosyltransferase involved in cell wall biosynthesis
VLVSVLILTYNEEVNLRRCLDAVSWCDDVVVLDSGSTDGTEHIAREYGARFVIRRFDSFAAQRNYALDHVSFKHNWILHLDADEVVTSSFRDALVDLSPPDDIRCLRVPFKTIFFDHWIRHAGMWPAFQVRIAHVSRMRFVQYGHGQRESVAEPYIGTFTEPLLHYSFSHGLAKWLDKHVRYAEGESQLIARTREEPFSLHIGDLTNTARRRRLMKALSLRVPLAARPFARFIYVYILCQGFRDGFRGFLYAFMLSTYEGMIAILVAELRLK